MMRIMLDSNILISSVVFQTSVINSFVNAIKTQHTIILSNLIIEECLRVVKAKFPAKLSNFEEFLSELHFEYYYLPEQFDDSQILIRDAHDKKILYSAYSASVEVLITGDKDFFETEYKDLEVLTAAGFVKKYIENE